MHCGEGLLESPEPLLTWFALAEATDAGLLRGVICCWGANCFGESEDLGLEPSDDLVCTSPSVISLRDGNKIIQIGFTVSLNNVFYKDRGFEMN